MSRESSLVKVLIAAVAALTTLLAVFIGNALTPDTTKVDIEINKVRIEGIVQEINRINWELRKQP